jgi:GT2 family glycosyltransferase
MRSSPELSAIVVVGNTRERAQLSLESLYAQSIADRMELIVIDLKTRDFPELSISSRVPTQYVTLGSEATWGQARARAVKMATAPVVAFIEDHCTADPGWAEALVRAHQEPWAAVGYAFTNPYPESYLSRAMLASEYGIWEHPTTSRTALVLPCGNVAYKRDLLLSMNGELEDLLTPDFVAHERFNSLGLPMYVESQAIVAHDSLVGLTDLFAASFMFCRILASKRVVTQRWNTVKRVSYGLATPIMGPPIAIWRLFSSRRSTPADWATLVIYLPVILVKGVASSLGESVGYLAGAGSAENDFVKWELHVDRNGER